MNACAHTHTQSIARMDGRRDLMHSIVCHTYSSIENIGYWFFVFRLSPRSIRTHCVYCTTKHGARNKSAANMKRKRSEKKNVCRLLFLSFTCLLHNSSIFFYFFSRLSTDTLPLPYETMYTDNHRNASNARSKGKLILCGANSSILVWRRWSQRQRTNTEIGDDDHRSMMVMRNKKINTLWRQ